ncbi:hypothetical protein F2Q70_00011388 [Brassica cretica]|uniref:Uncharacterized protein n=1 Tax=Brassica cretica TaxID=69181 RepID=A0A8S9LWI7_BRACR|nr:hypothetical protein F2Q70_00011388 [Brassica cretica]
MSSKRKSSTKSRHDRSVPDGSSSQHDDFVPKVEFSADSIDPQEIDLYWAARGEVKPPVPGLWVPSPLKTNLVAGCPSKSCPNGLAAIRHFCRVPKSVEFRLPEMGKLHVILPKAILRATKRSRCSHLVGILVLSYELGITLDADHLEAWVEPRWSTSLIVQVRPRPSMAIISGFASKYHYWKGQFFFVRVSDASVEANTIPFFRTRWRQRVFTTLSRVPEGLLTVRELLRGRPCFWANFSLSRVRRAIMLHRCRFQLDLPTEEGSESDTDGFIPYVPRTQKASSKPRKVIQIMVDEDVVDGRLSPNNILKDYLDSQAGGRGSEQFNLEGLLEFDFPPTVGGSSEVIEFAKAVRMVNGEVKHAYRRGKREVVEVTKKRRDKFSEKFGELKEHHKALADYRECRGTVGGLYLTQLPNYSYDGEYVKQTVRLAEKDTNFTTSEVEEKNWEQWDPVPVSPDTVEAETGDPGKIGEVNQPVAPLDVNDYSIGRSMSGNFDLGD